MIKITATGKAHEIKAIEVETGFDLTKYLADVKIEYDPKSSRFMAILTIADVAVNIEAVAKYVLKERKP